jgi:hypothetical protein
MAKKHTGMASFVIDVASAKDASAECRKIAFLG